MQAKVSVGSPGGRSGTTGDRMYALINVVETSTLSPLMTVQVTFSDLHQAKQSSNNIN